MGKRDIDPTAGGYPAEQYRLVDPDYRIDTPVDSRGLVDIHRHIDLVKQTLSDEIDWSGQEVNTHHFYWPSTDYPSIFSGNRELELKFRSLPIHLGAMPVKFHNWLHKISEPPVKPRNEVMEQQVQSWEVAASVFNTVSDYKRRARRYLEVVLGDLDRSYIGALTDMELEVINDIYDDFFDKLSNVHQELYRVPEEFRLVDPDLPFDTLTRTVGKIVGAKALYFTRTVQLS